MTQPFSVYSTWGFHDELGDRAELSEKLAMRALDTLERWKKDFGIGCDYFQLDYPWFDPDKGYRYFRKPQWPGGFGPALERIRALGMKPGLWFSTSGGHLRVPAWKPSLADNNWNYSLIDGPYAEAFESDILHAAEKWSARFFKFDFANFYAAAKGSKRPPEETYRLSVRRFKTILSKLRSAFPDVKIIAHCGFNRIRHEERSGLPCPASADPAWLDVLDALFSGDPHPCGIPRTDLTRNLDLFQDRQVWKMHKDGFPLRRIEDHGVILGKTNTCFYRGRRGFRRAHIGQLARGGRRDFFYGDPALLTDSDLKYMRAARALFFDAWERGLETSFAGPGEPGVAPWHGCLTGGGDGGLLYLVNGSMAPQQIELPLPGLFNARVLFHDGREKPPAQAHPDQLTAELGPEQMALLGLGYYAESRYDLGREEDAPAPRSTQVLPVHFRQVKDGWTGDAEIKLPPESQLCVIAQALDTHPTGPLTAPPFRFGKQNTRASRNMKPKAHDLLRVDIKAGGKRLKPVKIIPGVPVWSGISWVAKFYNCRGPARIEIKQRLDPPRRLRATAYAVSWQ